MVTPDLQEPVFHSSLPPWSLQPFTARGAAAGLQVNRESSKLAMSKNHMGQDLRTENVSKRYQIDHFLTNQLSQLSQFYSNFTIVLQKIDPCFAAYPRVPRCQTMPTQAALLGSLGVSSEPATRDVTGAACAATGGGAVALRRRRGSWISWDVSHSLQRSQS